MTAFSTKFCGLESFASRSKYIRNADISDIKEDGGGKTWRIEGKRIGKLNVFESPKVNVFFCILPMNLWQHNVIFSNVHF